MRRVPENEFSFPLRNRKTESPSLSSAVLHSTYTVYLQAVSRPRSHYRRLTLYKWRCERPLRTFSLLFQVERGFSGLIYGRLVNLSLASSSHISVILRLLLSRVPPSTETENAISILRYAVFVRTIQYNTTSPHEGGRKGGGLLKPSLEFQVGFLACIRR